MIGYLLKDKYIKNIMSSVENKTNENDIENNKSEKSKKSEKSEKSKKEETNTETDSYSDESEDFSDDEIDKEADSLKVSKEFEENVIKYVKLFDLIQKKNEEIRELKKMKKPCEEFILTYLDKVDVTFVEITDGKLRKNKSENKVPISQDVIRNAIAKNIKDPSIVNEILKNINTRPTKTQVNIKRTKNRGPKKIKKKTKK
jgi:hypothetical protein